MIFFGQLLRSASSDPSRAVTIEVASTLVAPVRWTTKLISSLERLRWCLCWGWYWPCWQRHSGKHIKAAKSVEAAVAHRILRPGAAVGRWAKSAAAPSANEGRIRVRWTRVA